MNLKNKVILVTGGAGFIGSHLVDRLIRCDPEKLVVVDNFFLGKRRNLKEARQKFKKLKIYNQDATSYNKMKTIMEKEQIEVVFDLAVIPLLTSHLKPKSTFKTNVELAMTICELIRKDYFDTLIHCSSSEAYGTLEYLPMNEEHPMRPKTPYAASKAAGDHLVTSYVDTFGIDAAIVRPFNSFGPRQNECSYAGVIPITIERILSNKPPIIHGDGDQTRDYIFVKDIVEAFIKVYNTKSSRGKAINIAMGREISIKKLIKMIANILGYDKKFLYEPERIGDVKRHRADIGLAKKVLGFKTKTSYETGLKSTVKWYKDIFGKN